MRIEDNFRVGLPVEDAWRLLLDVERVAPCMPGAELQEIEGDEYRGIVKVKVGPITAQYKGTARITQADEATRTIVLEATGRDTRGQGNANATVNLVLTPEADGTVVDLATDLSVTGKVAQFGRGVLADVSGKLLKQFVECLERDVLRDGAAATAATATTGGAAAAGTSEGAPGTTGTGPGGSGPDGAGAAAAPSAGSPGATAGETPGATATSAEGAGAARPGVRKVESRPAQPVDLVAVSSASLVKRLAPVACVVLGLWLIRRAVRRHRR